MVKVSNEPLLDHEHEQINLIHRNLARLLPLLPVQHFKALVECFDHVFAVGERQFHVRHGRIIVPSES